MLALEPRYVFDAAIATKLQIVAHGSVDTHQADTTQHDIGASIVAASRDLMASTDAHPVAVDRSVEVFVRAHNLAPPNHEIAFIDSWCRSRHARQRDSEGTRIVLIDLKPRRRGADGRSLKGEHGITGIHILSHGSDGHIQLGAS